MVYRIAILVIIVFISKYCFAQTNNRLNDTMYFNGFRGINHAETDDKPYFFKYEADSNKFKIQERFKVDSLDIQKFEKEWTVQYFAALKEQIDYFLEKYKKTKIKEVKKKKYAREIYSYYKNNYDSIIHSKKVEIERDYSKWDREYFGFYINGRKQIFVEFTSEEFKKSLSNYAPGVPNIRIRGALPVMMYDIEANKIILNTSLTSILK